MDMYCTQQSQKWVRKCKEWGAGWCRLREALCMRWSWWCWLQSVTLKTATLSLFLLWFIFQYQLADTPARLVFRVLLRLQCWCLVQDVLEVRPAKSVESQLLWFRADGHTAHVAIDLSLVLLCEKIQFKGVAWPPPRYGVSTMVSYTYPIAFLFWFGCVNALVPLSTFSQSQRRRLNNDAKNSRKLLPWQFIPLLHVYFLRQSLTPWATGWGAAAKPVSASIADIWTRPNWNSPCIDASDSSLGCTNKINQNSCEVFKFWTVLIFQGLLSPCYSAWWEHL